MNNQWFSKVAVWLVIALVLFTVFKQFERTGAQSGAIGYSDFLEEVRGKRVRSVTLQEGVGGSTEIRAKTTDDKELRTTATYLDRGLVGDLINNDVKFDVKPREEPSFLLSILASWGPILLLIGVWIYFMRQMQGGGKGGAFSFGKSKARMLDEANNTTTFADVAGCDEAKEEVKELVDFLKDPQKFQKLGGRIPRGVLLVGPPGTGKTLLAKAIAGEAKVPFFSISGSDFVEMFVGVGAARVRDMFEQAKKSAPCIIFVDEIDAVGRHRGAGLGGGNDEREQTLNQMLVEMDGFETNLGVIVMAATNRPDILDPALLRPGRFDRQVYVTLPDVRGREQILNVHMRKVPVGQDIRADILARGTPGFSGADLANLVNEAALFAARRSGRVVEMVDFEKAKDKIMMGPERKSMIMPEEERRNTAYHESGHALVARLMPKTDPVHKVTVIPRGRALGVTMQLPGRRPLQPRQGAHALDHRRAVRRPDRRGGLHAPDDDRREQRLRARDGDRPRHGHALRHDRRARADGLRRERGRGLPRPLGDQDDDDVGRDDAEGRPRHPPHHRRAVRDRAQADRGQPGQDARDGGGAAGMGDDRLRPDRRHHVRQAAANAQGLGRLAGQGERRRSAGDAGQRARRRLRAMLRAAVFATGLRPRFS